MWVGHPSRALLRRPPTTSMLLKVAINGKRMRNEHPAVPLTPHQQAQQAALAVAAGAGAIHVHPRDAHGRESLAPDDLAATLEAIRAACPSTPVGVSTGAWIVPEVDQRLALIGAWEVLPDFAGVNFHEPGALKVARLLLREGVAVEAGDLERPRGRALAPVRPLSALPPAPPRTRSGIGRSPRPVPRHRGSLGRRAEPTPFARV